MKTSSPATPNSPNVPAARVRFDAISISKGATSDAPVVTRPSHETVQLLARLGVAFATFDLTARCTELSPAAHSLLGTDAERVCRLGARLLEPLLGARTPATAEKSMLAPGAAFLLRAQRLPSGDPRRAGIVLFLPSRTATIAIDGASLELSRREQEVAVLITGGASTRDVACSLGISAHTVRRHTERIYTKLGVRSRMQLAVLLGGQRAGTYAATAK